MFRGAIRRGPGQGSSGGQHQATTYCSAGPVEALNIAYLPVHPATRWRVSLVFECRWGAYVAELESDTRPLPDCNGMEAANPPICAELLLVE
jgi:hypothetical protein